MRTPAKFAAAALLALAVAAPAMASPHGRHGHHGALGSMGGGPGFMGHGACAGGAMGASGTPLTPEQAKTVVDGRLTMRRSELRVGAVTEKDAQSYDVELVKPDGSVAQHLVIDKATGRPGGFGPRGHGGPAMVREKPLSAAQVHDIIAGQIAWRGEEAKVGKVAEKGADILSAEVVDASGKVIRTIEVNKKTGCFAPAL